MVYGNEWGRSGKVGGSVLLTGSFDQGYYLRWTFLDDFFKMSELHDSNELHSIGRMGIYIAEY